MRFLYDYDSTIADTFNEQLRLCNEQFGTSYTPEQFSGWRSEDVMTAEEADYVWGHNVFLNEDFQSKIRPVPGAVEGILSLLEMGHTGMIVSDRPTSLFEVTRAWLDAQGLEMVRLLFTHSKHAKSVAAKNTMSKAQAAWLYKLNGVIEDAPHHIEMFADKTWIKRIYAIDCAHNRAIEHDKVYRVFHWNEIVQDMKENPCI